MKRGDLILAATGSGFGGKPRPNVIIQSDVFAHTASLVTCLVTSVDVEASQSIRISLPPTSTNGLAKPSWIMVDKLVTVKRSKIARQIGTLDQEILVRLDRMLLVFLGLNSRRSP